MPNRLPIFITQEEFERLHDEALKLERKASKSRKRNIKEYRMALILGFEAGMRISEVVGLKQKISRCCKAEIEVKKEVNGNEHKENTPMQ